MAPQVSASNSAEGTDPESMSRSPSHHPAVPEADIAPIEEKILHAHESMTGNDGMHQSRDDAGIANAALLTEVRGSLHSMSNGIDEIATTVRDLIALDSDGRSSEDYEQDSGGEIRQISWAKLRSKARQRRRRKRAAARAQINTSDDESAIDEGMKMYPQAIPEVRECNHDHFYSRQSGDDKVYCVDILIAGDDLFRNVGQFMNTVNGVKSGSIQYWKPGNLTARTGDSSSQNNEKKWIRRIRVNSHAVMAFLRYLSRGKTRRLERPTVFLRPFQVLVSLHDAMKQRLEDMKTGSSKAIEVAHPSLSSSSTVRGDGLAKFLRKLSDDKQAIDEITCFVEFMDHRIMPDARRYRDSSSPPPKTIRSEDLWYLFKPGDLVYVPRDTSGRDSFRSTPFSQPFLRVIQTALGNFIPPPIGQPVERRIWSLFCHFIEHDGTSYAPVHAYIGIPRFDGEQKITDLPAYPVSYLDDEQLTKQAQADGETYISLIERRSGFYSGWTQTIDPLGAQITETSPEGKISSPQHIESEILVDFQETFSALPSWKPKFFQTTAADEGYKQDFFAMMTEDPEMAILEWDEQGRVKHYRVDPYLSADPTEENAAWKFISEDPLGQFRQATRRAPTGQFLALLPRRFFGYAVLERKFVQLSTRFVRSAELEANDKAFENLEIDRKYKQLILALVKSHFDKVETEKKRNVEIESQDLIRGKGKGVVILLHGVPGVGKTATAEAVALKWKKPLFPITCGDLGYTAESLEKSLSEIFRLAHHWGCILLLDEADVFITQRERHDLKRNALVSAFLRVLEYYNGIMFLTTNRAGVLDEAIKSRVHLNLYYDHLTEDQTVAIFRQHIQRLRNIEKQRNPDQNEQIMVLHKEILQFARDHFNQRGNSQGPGGNFGRWNGRQIRNAFLIASSLAHYDSEEEGDEDNDELVEHGRKKQKQLGRSQFELVAETTLMYDQYRQSVHSGKSDDHVAFEREERAMSSQPRSPTPVRMKSASMGFN